MRTPAFDLLWTGFSGLDPEAVKGPQAGAVILFARNLDPDPVLGPERCHRLIRGLQERWGTETALAVALDQEGGAVSRLRGWAGPTPSFRHIWEREGGAACARWGELWGRGLRLLGFNVDFAPVADLWDGIEGTGMGDRCASADPWAVAEAAGSFLNGLESTGVRGCLKHFPGLGGTRVDSHQALPELRDMEQIAKNLQPFRALAHRERLVMVAHLKTPGTCGLPASLHRGSVEGNPWGIRGRWIPDDLEMGGCGDWTWEDRVRLCLEAGHQALLVCQSEDGVAACAAALEAMPEKLWAPARERFSALRKNLLLPSSAPWDPAAWNVWLGDIRHEAAASQE
jgi:beta-N-acetylhexosaminidase